MDTLGKKYLGLKFIFSEILITNNTGKEVGIQFCLRETMRS